jgi:hypothetical protein
MLVVIAAVPVRKMFIETVGKARGGSRSAEAQRANRQSPWQVGSAGLALVWQRIGSVSSR